MGTGRKVRAKLVSVLVRDDKDLASVLVLEMETLKGGK